MTHDILSFGPNILEYILPRRMKLYEILRVVIATIKGLVLIWMSHPSYLDSLSGISYSWRTFEQ